MGWLKVSQTCPKIWVSLPNHLKSQCASTLTGAKAIREPLVAKCNGLFLVLLLCHTVYHPFLPLSPEALLISLGPLHGFFLLHSLLAQFLKMSITGLFLFPPHSLLSLTPLVNDSLAWMSSQPTLSIPDLHFHCSSWPECGLQRLTCTVFKLQTRSFSPALLLFLFDSGYPSLSRPH